MYVIRSFGWKAEVKRLMFGRGVSLPPGCYVTCHVTRVCAPTSWGWWYRDHILEIPLAEHRTNTTFTTRYVDSWEPRKWKTKKTSLTNGCWLFAPNGGYVSSAHGFGGCVHYEVLRSHKPCLMLQHMHLQWFVQRHLLQTTQHMIAYYTSRIFSIVLHTCGTSKKFVM